MRPGLLAALCAAASIAALPLAPAFAQPAAAAQPPAAAVAVQPEAIGAMKRMSAYLNTLQTFELRSDTVREEVNDNGQTLQFLGTTTYRVQRPNGFAITTADDRQVRELIYDGSSVTLLAPRMGVYATVPAPATIQEVLNVLADKYNVVVPLDDLFIWGSDLDLSSKLTAGYWVGYAKIAGQDADQYAFRQKGLDWQIWIARGARPLPLRVVLTATDDPAKPTYAANLAWDIAPTFKADTFKFAPPAGSQAIVFVAQK